MSRKKAANKRNKQARVKKAGAVRKSKAELPGLKHLAKPWQEFYRLVAEQVKQNKN